MSGNRNSREESLEARQARIRKKTRMQLSEDGDIARMAWCMGGVFIAVSAILWPWYT